MKKVLLAIVLFLLFPLVAHAQTVGDKPLLYVREGCPHCAKVEAFLDKYNLRDSVSILETLDNKTNQEALDAWFKKLNVTDPNQQGVPFFVVDDKTYFVGDVPIIEYLAKKNNITVDVNQYQSSSADTIFLVVGGLVLFAVLGYGIYSSFKKKN